MRSFGTARVFDTRERDEQLFRFVLIAGDRVSLAGLQDRVACVFGFRESFPELHIDARRIGRFVEGEERVPLAEECVVGLREIFDRGRRGEALHGLGELFLIVERHPLAERDFGGVRIPWQMT